MAKEVSCQMKQSCVFFFLIRGSHIIVNKADTLASPLKEVVGSSGCY